MNAKITPEIRERLRSLKHVALDMDGTIYMENNLFPFTLGFLDDLTRLGIGYSFLTNNPTKSRQDYLTKLAKMGISASEDNMYTSTLASIDCIKTRWPQAKKIFALGTPSMAEEFARAGFTLCEDSADDVPDVLVVAFDTTLVYSRLCRAAWWAQQGIPYLATNPDRICPTDDRTVLVDCGSLQKCIETATGRVPDVVTGKPDPTMLDGICHRHSIDVSEVAMVGDRHYTDLATAHNAGALGVLVLSGETSAETAKEVALPGDIVARDIAEFGEMIREVRG